MSLRTRLQKLAKLLPQKQQDLVPEGYSDRTRTAILTLIPRVQAIEPSEVLDGGRTGRWLDEKKVIRHLYSMHEASPMPELSELDATEVEEALTMLGCLWVVNQENLRVYRWQESQAGVRIEEV